LKSLFLREFVPHAYASPENLKDSERIAILPNLLEGGDIVSAKLCSNEKCFVYSLASRNLRKEGEKGL